MAKRILVRLAAGAAPLLATAAAAFALGTVLSSAASAATPCSNLWTGAAMDGEWNTANNWSLLHAPLATEHTCIQLPGAYTVHLAGNASSTVAGLDIGGTGSTPTLWVNGSNAGGDTTLTSTAGINNLSTIRLESTNSSYQSNLTVSGGALTNSGTVNVEPGSGGVRTLTGDIANSGTLNADYALTDGSGTFTNTGSVNVPAASSLIMGGGTTFTQTSGSVSNTGEFGIGAATLQLSGGSVTDALLHDTTIKLSGSASGLLEYAGTDPSATLSGDIPNGLEVWVHGGLAVSGISGNDSAQMHLQGRVTNFGHLLLQSSGSSYLSTLTTTEFDNLGTFQTGASTTGPVGLFGPFINDGTFQIDASLHFGTSGDTDYNGGTIAVAAGKTFTAVPNLTFVQEGGHITGGPGTFGLSFGSVSLTGGIVDDLQTRDEHVSFSGNNLPGTVEMAGSSSATLDGLIPSQATVWIHGGLAAPGSGAVDAKVTGGTLSNRGHLLLRSSGSAYTSSLTTTGFTNTGVLQTGANTTGPLFLGGPFTNNGTFQIDATLPFGADGDVDFNGNAIAVAAGQSLYSVANVTFTHRNNTVTTGVLGLSNGSFIFQGGAVDDVQTKDEHVSFPAQTVAAGMVEMTGVSSATLAGDIPSQASVWVHGGLAAPGSVSSDASVSAGAFTNSGHLLLQSSSSSFASTLTTTGLINDGTLQTGAPTTGPLSLVGAFTNHGTFKIDATLPFGSDGDVDSNGGSITVAPGKSFYSLANLAFTQTAGSVAGTAGSFGLSNGSFTFSGGTVADLQSRNEHVSFPAGANAAGTVEMTGTTAATLGGDISPQALVWIHGGLAAPGYGSDGASATAAALSNHGHLLLQSSGSNYTSSLTTSGFTNVGTFQTGAPTTGPVALSGPFNNQGTFNIDATLPFGANGDADSNTGTIDVAPGAVMYSVADVQFTLSKGSIDCAPGSFALSNGSFNFARGTAPDVQTRNEHVSFSGSMYDKIGVVEMTGSSSATMAGDIPYVVTAWVHGGLAVFPYGPDDAKVTAGPFAVNGALRLLSTGSNFASTLTVTNPDASTGTVTNADIIETGPGSTGPLTLNADLDNVQFLEVDSPMSLGGKLLNFSSGTLMGGRYRMTAPFRFANGGPINTLSSTTEVLLNGPLSDLEDGAGNPLLGQLATNNGSLTIENGRNLSTAAFTTSGTVQVGPNQGPTTTTLTSAGDFTETAGSVVLEDAASSINAAGGAVRLNGGTFSGAGNVGPTVINATTVKPGFSPGILTIAGAYVQTNAGTLHIDIQGPDAGTGFGQLNASGPVTLDGTLELVTAGNFSPQLGVPMPVITGSQVSGAFATVTGRHGDSSFYVVGYNPTSVTLTPQDRLPAGSIVDFSPTEGVAFTGTVAQFSDAEDPAGPASEYSAIITWGDGAQSDGTVVAHPGGGFDVTGSHAYAEEKASIYGATATVTDNDAADGAPAAVTKADGDATVVDAALHATGSTIPTLAGTPYSGPTATFSDDDPGGVPADYAATIDWGDGTATSPGTISPANGGGFTVSGTHTYATTGNYTPTTTITDAGGSQTVAKGTASVGPQNPPVVPEAPMTALLVLLGAGVGGALWMRRRVTRSVG